MKIKKTHPVPGVVYGISKGSLHEVQWSQTNLKLMSTMTEQTRATCIKILDRVLKQEYEEMFTPQNNYFQPELPWRPTTPESSDQVEVKVIRVNDRLGINTPEETTMRKFCHYLFKNHQDELLAIIQSNRGVRKKVLSETHPFVYRRCHDEAAVDALNKLALTKGFIIKGEREKQVNSYGEYRSEHLNYKSNPGRKNNMNIPVVAMPTLTVPKTIPTFVSNNDLDETVKKAIRLAELDKERLDALSRAKKIDEEVADDLRRQEEIHKKCKDIEKEQRELIRQLSGG